MKTITSRKNPLVRRYRDAAGGDAAGLLLLDGEHLIHEAVRVGLAFDSVVCSPGPPVARVPALVKQLEAAGVEVYTVPEDVMRAASPVQTPSGIVALARRPARPLSEALGDPPGGRQGPAAVPPLLIVAVDVQDPGNVGAIVRAAEAGGASGAIFTGASADPFGWKALRGSMGSALRLPTVKGDTSVVLSEARERGIRIVATVPRGGRSPFEAELAGPVALCVGGEGPGLPADLVAGADERVSIPMRAPVESLNVAVAAALLVYEASRQRGTLG